jgi:hypothetical protein
MSIRRGGLRGRAHAITTLAALVLTALPAAAERAIPAALTSPHDPVTAPRKTPPPTPAKVPSRSSAPAASRPRAAPRPAGESAEAAQARADTAALRSEIAELRALLRPPAAEPASRPEDPKETEKREGLRAERKAASDKVDSIHRAVTAGLDPSLVAESLAKLQKRVVELDADLAAPVVVVPEEPAPSLHEMPRELRRMSDSLMALHVQIASLDHRERGAEPAPAAPPPKDAADGAPAEGKKLGLDLDLGVASLYAFRGLNLFKHSGQNDANALFAPAITWTIGETGFSVGYVGAYQWTGSNRSELVDAGIGHEQDLIAAYTRAFSDKVTGVASLTYYAYPFAKKSAAGTSLPSYLEPGVAASYTGAVDLGFSASFFAGVQQALAQARYAYLRPSVGKTFPITGAVDVSLLGGVGVKLFTASRPNNDNMIDLGFDLRVKVKAGARAYVMPAVHYGWTNLKDLGVADEQMVWGSLNTGLSL